MISTRELAALIGVSQSTISRSLNDHPAISTELKERIRKLAKEHGYLQQKRSKKCILSPNRKAIGILLMSQPFFSDLFINHLMSILYREIKQENYYAMPLLDFTAENDGVEKIRDLIKLDIIEGFIIINRKYDEAIDRYLSDIGLPHVYLLHCNRDSFQSIDMIDTDNYYGGYLGTQHLIRHGHRNIVTISSPWREFEDRTDGYLKALKECGITPAPDYMLCCDCTYEASYQTVSDNIHLFPTATAIYAQSDLVAFGAINALKDRGLQVPEDVSVVGSDGYDLGIMCRPQLDSVAHPTNELVKLSVQRLLEIAGSNGKHTPRQIILHPYIIERGSVAT